MEQVLTLRTNTSTYTLTDVLDEVHECARLVAALGYPELLRNHYVVEFSTRRVKNFGSCQKVANGEYKIILNKYYVELASPEHVHNTIVHEVIHSVTGCMNHQYKWKYVARQVNAKYQFTPIERLGHDENYYNNYSRAKSQTRYPYKYRVICEGCDTSWKYKKKSHIVQVAPLGRCTCPHCKSKKFRVETI